MLLLFYLVERSNNLSSSINILTMQDSEPDIIDGVGAETGHVIRTTIGGRGGQPKQVSRRLSDIRQ